MAPKIFGIGWKKTGTTSLGEALSLMGTRHCSYRPDLLWTAMHEDFSKLTEVIASHDSFDDWPWSLFYREIDEYFPGSRFILTVRDEDEATASYFNMLAQLKGDAPIVHAFRRFVYGGTLDEETFRAYFRKHNDEVKAYFKNRPNDLLELNIFNGEGWDELEKFTGLPRPATPFPHANKGTY